MTWYFPPLGGFDLPDYDLHDWFVSNWVLEYMPLAKSIIWKKAVLTHPPYLCMPPNFWKGIHGFLIHFRGMEHYRYWLLIADKPALYLPFSRQHIGAQLFLLRHQLHLSDIEQESVSLVFSSLGWRWWGFFLGVVSNPIKQKKKKRKKEKKKGMLELQSCSILSHLPLPLSLSPVVGGTEVANIHPNSFLPPNGVSSWSLSLSPKIFCPCFMFEGLYIMLLRRSLICSPKPYIPFFFFSFFFYKKVYHSSDWNPASFCRHYHTTCTICESFQVVCIPPSFKSCVLSLTSISDS